MKKIPCEIWSRVVGYFRPISQWNAGMKSQFQDRIMYKIEKEKEIENNN
jgi:ribonucleoside-triphosphate reductase